MGGWSGANKVVCGGSGLWARHGAPTMSGMQQRPIRSACGSRHGGHAAAILVSGTAALAAWYELGGTRIQLYNLDFADLTAQPVFRPVGRDRQDP